MTLLNLNHLPGVISIEGDVFQFVLFREGQEKNGFLIVLVGQEAQEGLRGFFLFFFD